MLLPLVLALLVLAVVVRIFLESRKNYPPGPFSFPYLGSFKQTKLINTLVHEETVKLGDEYGDLIFFKMFMDQPVLIIRGYDLLKEAVFKRAFSGVGRPLTFQEHGLHRRLGLIFTDGDNWQQMRRFTLRSLHDHQFGRKSRSDNINEELAEVLEPLVAAAGEGRDVEARGLFTLAAVNSLLQLVLGTKLDRGSAAQRLVELVDRIMVAIGPASLHLELFSWLRHVAPGLSGYREFRNAVQELVNVFRPLIAEHAAKLDMKRPANDLIDDFLQHQRRTPPPSAFTDDNLRVVLKDLLIAGLGTVNTAMEWVLLQLARHPAVQARAAAEVELVVGRDRLPHIDDMPLMPYLQAVLDETMRWMPPLPLTQHATTFGATELGGHHVPAGCHLLFDLYSVLHDRAFWGDPEKFRPERFLSEDAPRLRKRLVFFGLGLRHCIGETHARQSMFLFTAGLLQRLQLRLRADQPEPAKPLPDLVMKPLPYRLRVQLRE